MSKLAFLLKRRLELIFGIDDIIPKIYRTRAGYWQRAQGAWSWFMITKDNRDVGSQRSATKVLNAKKLSRFSVDSIQIEIIIEEY